MDAKNNQLLSGNNVRSDLDICLVTKKLTITFDIAYYIVQNCEFHELQVAVNEVDDLFVSGFDRQLKMIGQGPTYWSRANHVSEGGDASY